MAAILEPASTTTATPPAAPRNGSLPPLRVDQPRAGRRRLAEFFRAVVRLVVLLVVGALVWLGVQYWDVVFPPPPVAISGVIEAEEIVVSSEIAGRLVALSVTEGQRIAAGAEVGRLDDSRLRLQFSMGDTATQRQLALEADRYVLRAPLGGQVTRVVARVGEFTAPGQPVLVVADLAEVNVNLYVPVRDLGSVRVGQAVALTADPYPGRTFPGVITSVNPRSEYTPRNVQSQRDRLNLVFGVKAKIPNRDGTLIPGLPVQATIATDAPSP